MNISYPPIEIDLANAHRAYCNAGYKIMCRYRLEDTVDIPTRNWFRERAGTTEGWEILESMRLVRSEDPKMGSQLNLYLLNQKTPSFTFCTTDSFFQSEHKDAQLAFKEKEIRRRKYGVWLDLPSFDKNNPDDIRRRVFNPLFGRIQLLSGAHYFELNYLKLVDTKTFQVIQCDFNRKSAQLLDCFTLQSDCDSATEIGKEGILVFKPRGVRFTSDTNAFLLNKIWMPHYYRVASIIDLGSKCGEHLTEKVILPCETLPNWLKSDFQKSQQTLANNASSFRLKYRTTNTEDQNEKDAESSYQVKGAKPKNYEGQRKNAVFLDEVGMYEFDITEVLNHSRALLLDGKRQITGSLIAGGTSDNKNKNMDEIKKIARHPMGHRLFTFFIGVQHHRYVDTESGWADEERCVQEELKTRELKSKTDSVQEMISYCIINAISIEDCYFEAGETMLDKYRINLQISNIHRQTQLGELNIQRGWLHPTWEELQKNTLTLNRNHIQKPYFSPHPEGGWHIYEFPDDNMLRRRGHSGTDYFSGADNLNRTLDPEEAAKVRDGKTKMSLVVQTILKTHTYEPVAMYRYRHGNPKADFYQTMLGCFYYNCYLFPETNKENHLQFFIEDTLFGLIRAGEFLEQCLYPTPIKKRTYRKGYQFGMDTGSHKEELYHTHIINYFAEHTEKVWFEELLTACVGWDIKNKRDTPDEGMALLFTLIGLEDMRQTQNRKMERGFNPYNVFPQSIDMGVANIIRGGEGSAMSRF